MHTTPIHLMSAMLSRACEKAQPRCRLSLLANAVVPSRICDAGNNPLTIHTQNSEQVRPAVAYLAIHQKLERSPHHRQIVIDPHQRIMNSLLNAGGSRLSYPVGKIFKRHLTRLAIPHQHHGAAAQQRFLHRRGVAFCHAIKQLRDRRQDRLLLRAIAGGHLAVEPRRGEWLSVCRMQRGNQKNATGCCNSNREKREKRTEGDFHGTDSNPRYPRFQYFVPSRHTTVTPWSAAARRRFSYPLQLVARVPHTSGLHMGLFALSSSGTPA